MLGYKVLTNEITGKEWNALLSTERMTGQMAL